MPIDELDQVLQLVTPRCVLLDRSLVQGSTDTLVRRLRKDHPELLIGQIVGSDHRAINLADFSVAEEDVARRLLMIPAMSAEHRSADSISDSGSSVWFETGPDGQLASWSASFAALLGRPPTIGELVWSLVRLQLTVERGEQDWLELLRSSRPVTMAGTMCTASRRELAVRLTVGVRRLTTGEIEGLRGRIHPEDDLLAFQPEWLTALWAGTGFSAVLACGTTPRIVSATPEAWRFFSATPDRIGRPLSDLHSWPLAVAKDSESMQVPTVEVEWWSHGTTHVTTAHYITWIVGRERWWLIHYPEVPEREERRELRVIADTLNITRGDRQILQVLSERLAQILNAACVTVVEFHPKDRSLGRLIAAHGLAFGAKEPWQPLGDTPCGRVQQRKFICVARDLRREFPDSTVVADYHFESFMGAVLCSEAGDEIGVLCVFHTEALQQVRLKRAIVMLHAMRSAAELSHLRTTEMLREQAERLAEVQQLARIGGWEFDPESDQLVLSPELAGILGRPDCRQCRADAFFVAESLARFRYHLAARERDPVARPMPSEYELLSTWPVRFVSLLIAQPRNPGTGRLGHGIIGDIRERVEIQHVHVEYARGFRSLVSQAPLVFARIDSHGFVRFAGGAGLARASRAASEYIGLNIVDLQRTAGACELVARIRAAAPARLCLEISTGVWFDAVVEPLRNRLGAPDGCFVLGLDITAQRCAEQSLAVRTTGDLPSPAALPPWLPVEKVSTGLVALDRQSVVLLCNRAANDLLGPDCKERSATLARWSTRYVDCSEPGARYFDERVGLDRWLRIEVHPNNAAGAEAGGVLIELRDITQIKSLQHESQLKHILLAGILDSLEDGVVTIDRQGNIVSANRAATEIFDWSTEDLLGQRIDILLTPGVADAHHTTVGEFLRSSVLRRRLSERGPILARRRDGSTFPAEIALTKVEIEGTIYLSAVISDVSEIEEMRRRQNLLTRELHNHERFETLGRLVGGVAHDFNNLIMGIAGFTEMAQEDAENPVAVREGLSHVLQACNRARVLILQMQLAGRSEPAPSALVDLKSVATEVLRLCGTLKPSNCVLDLDCTTPAILVHGHSGQLHEVLLNLIKNGCQALRDQSGKIVVRLSPAAGSANSTSSASEQGMVSIEVEDDGVGIPKEDIDHIFEPFFTTKNPEEGTGLGLAVVRRIVENHGGRIGVESTIGRGTLFRIVLPAAACPFPVVEPAAPTSPTDLHGISAWVVEDDQMIRHFLQRGLTALGAEVRTFANAAAALGAARQSVVLPAVVVTDRMMAKLDGVEFARRLHLIHPHLPIMLITGWLGQTSSAELQRAGIVSVLPKPFAVEALARELMRCVTPDVPQAR